MNKFDQIKKEIEEILPKSPIVFELKHSQLTLKWVFELKPEADEALQIAAMAHDIDRAITGITEKDLKDFSKIDECKKEHAIRSADITEDLMKKHGYNKEMIEKVRQLIENHEVGGQGDVEILKDADSISYFDYNVGLYFKRYGKERTKDKIKFMYKRLSNDGKEQVNQIEFKDKMISDLFKEAISEL